MDAEQRARLAEIGRRHRKLGTWPCTECGGPCDVQTVLAVYDAAVEQLAAEQEARARVESKLKLLTEDTDTVSCPCCRVWGKTLEAALAGEEGH